MKLPNPPYTFIFDLDNTLIDTESYKTAVFHGLAHFIINRVKLTSEIDSSKNWNGYVASLYDELRSLDRTFVLNDLCGRISQLLGLPQNDALKLVRGIRMERFLFGGTLGLLKELSQDNQVVIYTEGDIMDQTCKIEQTGINRVLEGNEIHHLGSERGAVLHTLGEMVESGLRQHLTLIDDDKKDLEQVVRTFARSGREIFVVDDKPSIVRDVVEMRRYSGIGLIPVWMRQGHYAETTDKIEGALTFNSPAHMKGKLEESVWIGSETRIIHWPPQTRR